MTLKELLPVIDEAHVAIYEKKTFAYRFIVIMNPRKDKGAISNKLLEREIYSISHNYNGYPQSEVESTAFTSVSQN